MTRGITDVLREIGRYEPITNPKFEDIEVFQDIEYPFSNLIQVFRESFKSDEVGENFERERQEYFEKIKWQIDWQLLHGQKALTFFKDGPLEGEADLSIGPIQSAAGLDQIINEKGAVVWSVDYGVRLFDQFIDIMIAGRFPNDYLMVCQKDEYKKVMGAWKELSSGGIEYKDNYCSLHYKGFKFLITSIDICDTASSYLLPMSQYKSKDGKVKNRFGASYIPNPGSKNNKRDEIIIEWEFKNGEETQTDFLTCQTIKTVGERYFIKINHHNDKEQP